MDKIYSLRFLREIVGWFKKYNDDRDFKIGITLRQTCIYIY